MSRARSPNRDKAFEIYKNSNGKIKLKDIAEQLQVKDTQIRKWKSQDNWDEKLKGTLPKNKSNVTNDKKTKKVSKRADSRLTKESYPLQARPNNKNAVKTGEFESIFFDSLDLDEHRLIKSIDVEKKNLLIQEIQLLTVRERRMLKRIAKLKEKEMTLVSFKTGMERDKETDLNEYEGTLGQIQNIEEALTRVQDKKQKAINMLHRFDIDESKLDLEVMKTELAILKQGGDEGEVEDDGFIEALNAQVEEVWDDEEY